METGDTIVNELSTSNIVEDDLNGIFNNLEPLEDPKDDMYFFVEKDLLQRAREKNPTNTTVAVHRPNPINKPQPPPSRSSKHASNTLVPTATCDPQPSLAPLAQPAKPITSPIGNDAKPLSSAAIASASASIMYLDNFLAATGASNTNTKIPPLTSAPPPLPTVLDRPSKTHHHPSILRRPSHKAARSLSKSHPAYAQLAAALAAHSAQPTNADSKLGDSNPLQHSTSSIGNVNVIPSQAQTSPITASAPTLHSTTLTNSHNITPTKRSKASYLKSSNELKHSRVIYNPNTINNNASTLHSSSEISAGNTVGAINHNNNNRTIAQPENNALATSGTIPRPVTAPIEVTESAPAATNNYYVHNNNNNNTKLDNNNISGHRPTAAVDYMNYAYNPYFPYYSTGIVNGFYPPHIANDAYVGGPEQVYNPRPEPQVSYDPATEPVPVHPPTNPSNDLYSNLYLYSFNNNTNNTYARTTTTTPIPDANSTYNNLYNYNNLYMNSLYGYPTYPTYPTPRQYTTSNYHKNTTAYDSQAYRSSENFDENYDDEDDYRADRPYSKSKRSKRRSDDDEYRKPSRKSKARSKSKRKQPPTYEETSLHDSTGLSAIHASSDLPKGEGAVTSIITPPLSPAQGSKRAKANLFENTPKIKIGEPQGGNAKISKLGRKLLQVMHLDWHTPYAQEGSSPSTPVVKTPPDGSGSLAGVPQNQDKFLEPQDQQTYGIHGHSNSETSDAVQSATDSKVQVFADYDTAPERKTELLYFVANNIESLLTIPTKIEITLNDFKSSALGSKVRQRLEVLTTIKQAKELGLILFERMEIVEEQFAAKQKQFLDAFTFGAGNPEKKAAS